MLLAEDTVQKFVCNCTFLKKPFMSFARLVCYPEAYGKADLPTGEVSLARLAEDKLERAMAKRTCERILEHNGLFVYPPTKPPKITKKEKAKFVWEWTFDGDLDNLRWYEPGTVTIEIPPL